jgi:glycosyltransferase involved in cell wall biosynthesis
MKITAVILTYNESARIRIALSHALIWADEVCVVDKLSTDDTREIAQSMGAKVFTIPFSKQDSISVVPHLTTQTVPSLITTKALSSKSYNLSKSEPTTNKIS